MVLLTTQGTDRLHIKIKGDVSKADIKQLQNYLDNSANAKSIELEMSQVDFAGSNFLNFLASLKSRSPETAAKLSVCNPNSSILELLQLSQLDQIFRVRRSEPAK